MLFGDIRVETRLIQELAQAFDLSFPFSQQDLKAVYRKRAPECHPDTGGDEERFKKLQEAYELLETFASDNGSSIQDDELRTTDGRPLSELGKGLGPTTNGKPCSRCNGVGYTESTDRHTRECPACDGEGWTDISECRDCRGSGRFTLRSGRNVTCRRCNGTGQFQYRRPVVCQKCLGMGHIFSSGEARTVYDCCWECGGTGELLVMNPVFQKGAIV